MSDMTPFPLHLALVNSHYINDCGSTLHNVISVAASCIHPANNLATLPPLPALNDCKLLVADLVAYNPVPG